MSEYWFFVQSYSYFLDYIPEGLPEEFLIRARNYRLYKSKRRNLIISLTSKANDITDVFSYVNGFAIKICRFFFTAVHLKKDHSLCPWELLRLDKIFVLITKPLVIYLLYESMFSPALYQLLYPGYINDISSKMNIFLKMDSIP